MKCCSFKFKKTLKRTEFEEISVERLVFCPFTNFKIITFKNLTFYS